MEQDEGDRTVLQQWRNRSPSQIKNESEISIADHLKRVQKMDPDFTLSKYDHHRNSEGEFD